MMCLMNSKGFRTDVGLSYHHLPDAIRDLTNLRNYIADVLLAPDAALIYFRTIRREIVDFARMPARNQLIYDSQS